MIRLGSLILIEIDNNSMPTSEAQVVHWLVDHLLSRGVGERSVDPERLVVDRDGSYVDSPSGDSLSDYFGTPRIAGRRPDVLFVANGSTGERVIAVEVKASARDYEKGATQAVEYRQGCHESYLCIPASRHGLARGLNYTASTAGVGVVTVSADQIEFPVRPAVVTPDPYRLATTERYLSERVNAERRFQLNNPLNSVAALVACVVADNPKEHMLATWNLARSSVNKAFKDAETLGLIRGDTATAEARSYAFAIRKSGFDLSTSYSKRARLTDEVPVVAAILRIIYLQQRRVRLIVESLRSFDAATTDLTSLALRAFELDEGTARAVFGEPTSDEPWRPVPTTVYQLKRALWFCGILASKTHRKVSNLKENYPDTYRPSSDTWSLDPEYV